MTKYTRSILAAALAAALPAVAGAQATLVTTGTPVSFSGTGLGTVATVLTLNSQANNTIEMGCVGRNATGTADIFGNLGSGTCVAASPTPDLQTGMAQTQTRLLSEVGITSASQFGLLFNATEPSGNGITVQSLTATFFSSTGAVIGTATLASQFTTMNTATGIGNTGFLFTLSGAALNSNVFAADTRVGLSATVGCTGTQNPMNCQFAEAGNDTFFLVNTGAASVVPEPGTYALLGTGLAGLGGLTLRRRRRGNA
jgi:hypothetical protein